MGYEIVIVGILAIILFAPMFGTQDQIFASEIAHYEDTYDVKLPPVRLQTADNENMTVLGYYVDGGDLFWTNTSGHEFQASQTATIVLLNSNNWTEDKTRHVIRHELCHHYIRSVCHFSTTYGTRRGELPLAIEEGWCHNYVDATFGNYNTAHYEQVFRDCQFQ